MITTRTGGRACGAVRNALKGEPFRFGECYCTSCRKESGSVFVGYAQWRIEDSEVSGKFSSYAGRSFCPLCGSRLFDLHAHDIEIRIGSLDEAPTTLGVPLREGWVKRREGWLVPVDGIPQHIEEPPPT